MRWWRNNPIIRVFICPFIVFSREGSNYLPNWTNNPTTFYLLMMSCFLGHLSNKKVFYVFRYIQWKHFFFLKTRLKRLSISKAAHNMTKWIKTTQSAANMIKQKFYYMVKVAKGQLNSEWVYEVIVSPKMQTKNH